MGREAGAGKPLLKTIFQVRPRCAAFVVCIRRLFCGFSRRARQLAHHAHHHAV